MAKTTKKAEKRAAAAGRGKPRTRQSGAAKARGTKSGKLSPANSSPPKKKPSAMSETARLRAQLKAARLQQEATAEVLQVISKSPGELRPVFKAVLENATRICDARFGTLFRFDGKAFHFAADVGTPQAMVDYMRRPGPVQSPAGGMIDRIHRTRQVQHTADYAADAVPGLAARLGGARSTLGVPILRDDTLVGAIVIYRQEVRPFSDREIELVRSFAAQAAIAIENARLFNETQEALARQTASADILRVISASPTDVQPVFDAIVGTAVRLIGCDRAFFMRVDGQTYTPVAGVSRDGPIVLGARQTIDPAATFPSRAIATKQMLHLPDWSKIELPEYERTVHERHGVRCSLLLPLLRGDDCIGLLALVASQPNMFGESEIALAESFRDQALIAIENTRLFNETQEALERQTATADVLKVISRSTFDLDSVLETLVTSAAKLCEAEKGVIFLRDGQHYRLAYNYGFSPEFEAFAKSNPFPVDGGSTTARAVLSEGPVQIVDVLADQGRSELAQRYQRLGGYRTNLGVALRRGGETIGVFTLTRQQVREFTQRQIELVQTFADQAVIAIENTRLFSETQEALERQIATADILKVIASSPSDVLPVFNAIVGSAARLFDPCAATIIRLQDGELRWQATATLHPDFDAEEARAVYPLPFEPDRYPSARAILERRIVEIPDTEAPGAPDTPRQAGRLSGFRSVTLVPLVSDNRGIGTIILTHPQSGFRLSEKQLALVQTFADQAVIAIENVRLFDEVQAKTGDLEEALQQQTATSDVLKVISRSAFDLQTVLETLTRSATDLSGARNGVIFLRDGDIFRYRASSHDDSNPEWVKWLEEHPQSAGRSTATARAIATGRVACVADVIADPEIDLPATPLAGIRAALGVPLLRDGKVEGVMTLTRQTPGTFTDRQIELVQTFADQAVIAIENARLFDEVQAKTRDLEESLQQQTATADVLKVISRSAFDLQTVLETLIKSAVELSGANRGSIFLREGEVFPLKAASSTTPEFLDYWAKNPARAGRSSATSRVIASGKVENIPDVLEDPDVEMPAGSLARIRAALGVPMLRDNKVEGVLVLTRPEPGLFSKSQIELVQTFADQATIAIENARLFNEVQARTNELSLSLDELRTAQDRLIQTEKLASLGQLTAGIAHEIKNPLNFVNNFSSLSGELISELNEVLKEAPLDDKTREEIDELTAMLTSNLEKVVQHGKRADSIVKNMLLHSREGSGEHRPADINAIVEESLNLAYHGARAEKSGFNITLQRDLDPSAGTIDLYPQEITRVFLNLISNGFYAAHKRKETGGEGFEPSLTAITRNLGNKVEIRIRDNGTGIPVDVKEKMFNPFFTTKPAGEGTGLGLSMSHDIVVKQHGGKIEVETEPGQFTEFIITLPRAAAQSGGRN